MTSYNHAKKIANLANKFNNNNYEELITEEVNNLIPTPNTNVINDAGKFDGDTLTHGTGRHIIINNNYIYDIIE